MRFLSMLRGEQANDGGLTSLFPMLPIDALELPGPGPDFDNYSSLLENKGILYKTKEFELQQLYYRAMYDDMFATPCRLSLAVFGMEMSRDHNLAT